MVTVGGASSGGSGTQDDKWRVWGGVLGMGAAGEVLLLGASTLGCAGLSGRRGERNWSGRCLEMEAA